MGRTTALRGALRTVFYPHVEARGFVVDKIHQPQFTVFRRHVGATVQVFDIQWDKYGNPRFVLNFGEAPADGVVRQGKPVPANSIEVFDCSPMLRLQRKRGGTMACWFQLRRRPLQQLTSLSRDHTPEQVAAAVVESLAEVEEWWKSKTRGPHVHGLA